jgi:addiction module RelE/StbE family toxin
VEIEWLGRAERDLDLAIDYILANDAAAAMRVYRTIRFTVERLGPHPEIGRVGRVSGTRELVVPRLPYVVAYRIHESRVQILRVLHTSRRWPERL